MSITIHEGSILDLEVDAIVNPANGHLNHAYREAIHGA